MGWKSAATTVLVAGTLALTPLLSGGTAYAHCDTRDGPVVEAAQQALDTGDQRLVTIWVQEKDEPELHAAFDHARKVRALGPEAKGLADEFFFETVVRLHRAGEGAPYTGLKPAGLPPEPAVAMADHALTTGNGRELAAFLEEALHEGLHEQFQGVAALKSYAPGDVEAGRAFVNAYVEYVHWVERVYESAVHGAAGHFPDGHTASTEATAGDGGTVTEHGTVTTAY
ncbi:MAG TPA: DUF6448 family protein [Chloroflexota bacterium]|nr:DUF6448 family protein [Chloroflexota bacterium]